MGVSSGRCARQHSPTEPLLLPQANLRHDMARGADCIDCTDVRMMLRQTPQGEQD